jgi:hypothetical protein
MLAAFISFEASPTFAILCFAFFLNVIWFHDLHLDDTAAP